MPFVRTVVASTETPATIASATPDSSQRRCVNLILASSCPMHMLLFLHLFRIRGRAWTRDKETATLLYPLVRSTQ